MKTLLVYLLLICLASETLVRHVGAVKRGHKIPWRPRLQIIQAYYGGRDVTAKVRAIVLGGRREIAASNHIFGDPMYGNIKTLVVAYRYGHYDPQLATAVEGTTLFLAPPYPIMKAFYGPLDVTAKVAKLVAEGARTITVSNNVFGDPLRGHRKTLTIMYVNRYWQGKVAYALEHQTIKLDL